MVGIGRHHLSIFQIRIWDDEAGRGAVGSWRGAAVGNHDWLCSIRGHRPFSKALVNRPVVTFHRWALAQFVGGGLD
jgi:hypothetical protein